MTDKKLEEVLNKLRGQVLAVATDRWRPLQVPAPCHGRIAAGRYSRGDGRCVTAKEC